MGPPTAVASRADTCREVPLSPRNLATVAHAQHICPAAGIMCGSGRRGWTCDFAAEMEYRMKKLLLAGLAVTALYGAAATPADPSPAAPVSAPPPPVNARFPCTARRVGA